MGTASLETLTNELFDMVVQHLELGDIRNLRLVSKATCSKATQDKFVSYMLKKHVNLTQEDLEIFERMTSQGYRLGCLVRHLILVGVQYDTSMLEETVNTGFQTTKFSCGPMSKRARVYQCSDEELDYFRESRDQLRRLRRDDDGFRDAGKDLVLLSQSLQNIARHATKGLDTLSLQVVVYNTDIAIPKSTIHLGNRERQEFFQTAERTFVLVASALWESSLSIRRFEVFDTVTDSLTSRLPYDTFNQLNWSSPGHDWSSFRAMKKLSLSLSDRLMPTDLDASALDLERAATPQPRLSKKELERELSVDDLHSVSLVNMQSLCTNLEELCITWYRIFPNESTWECQRRYPGLMARRHTASGRTWQHTNGKPQWMARQLYMHHLARAIPFPHLRVFHLGGLSVHAEDLCKFVEKNRPTLQEVFLDNVQAVDSKFTSLFALLAHPNSMIKRIRLEDLHENLDILHYSKEQESQCTRVSGLYYETNFIERWGEDVKRQIEYFTRDVRYSGTKENWYADKDKRAKFGSHYAGMPEVAQDL